VVTGDGDAAANRRYGRSGNKESAGFVHIALFSRLLYSNATALKRPLKWGATPYSKCIKVNKSNTYSRRGMFYADLICFKKC
jgi:hypothetical protein